jgi:ribose 5-phosphate isomerase B
MAEITVAEIEQMVRQAVLQALGLQRPIVDAEQVQQMAVGGQLSVSAESIITPLARQLALERKVTFSAESHAPAATGQPTVAIGADHGGYALKEQLKPTVEAAGFAVFDCGTHSTDAVDYPDVAYAVARLVADGRAQWGIIIDGAGIGSCMTANKVPGVRAALCYDQASAANSREHNLANVLTLGAGLIGANLARQIVQTWLNTPHGTGRHARRVEKMMQIERRFLKSAPSAPIAAPSAPPPPPSSKKPPASLY